MVGESLLAGGKAGGKARGHYLCSCSSQLPAPISHPAHQLPAARLSPDSKYERHTYAIKFGMNAAPGKQRQKRKNRSSSDGQAANVMQSREEMLLLEA